MLWQMLAAGIVLTSVPDAEATPLSMEQPLEFVADFQTEAEPDFGQAMVPPTPPRVASEIPIPRLATAVDQAWNASEKSVASNIASNEDKEVVLLRTRLEKMEKELAELRLRSQQLEERTNRRIDELELRLGDVLAGAGAARLPTGVRGSSLPPVNLKIRLPGQAPSGVTQIQLDVDGGRSLRLVGAEPVDIQVPNTGKLPFRTDGDAVGFSRTFEWDPRQAAQNGSTTVELPLSLKPQP